MSYLIIEVELVGQDVRQFQSMTWKQKEDFLRFINVLFDDERLTDVKKCRTCGRLYAVIRKRRF